MFAVELLGEEDEKSFRREGMENLSPQSGESRGTQQLLC